MNRRRGGGGGVGGRCHVLADAGMLCIQERERQIVVIQRDRERIETESGENNVKR
jgi:hypothetical protein